MVEYVLIKIYCEDMFINGMRVLGFIFYWRSVVGGVVNCINVIYGGTMRLRMYAIMILSAQKVIFVV